MQKYVELPAERKIQMMMIKTKSEGNSLIHRCLSPGLAMIAMWISHPLPVSAQHQHGAKSEGPPMLFSGLGSHSHPINTRSPEAQKFFDQGLTLLYGFNRYEALRSFRRAAELDPEALMPHWGMGMAQGPYINIDLDGGIQMKESCEAVRAGRALHDHASERERGYFDAVAARCPDYRPAEYARV